MNTDVAYLSQLQNDLLAAAERGAVRRRTTSRRTTVAVGVLAALILAAAVGTVVPRWTQRSASVTSAAPHAPAGSDRDFEKLVPAASPAPEVLGAVGASGGAFHPAAGTVTGRASTGDTASAVVVPTFGPKIVKTAHMDLQVPNGGFERAFGEATQVAAANGGFVVSSSSGGTSARSGTLVLRVPSGRFEAALQSLRSIGTVKWQTVNGRDVTAAYIDLTARIRTWRSQQAVLYRLMGQATSIGQTLQIQSQLQRVQLTIEQLQGQLRLLRNQSAFGTISLSIREAGVRPAATNNAQSVTPTMVRAWRNAVGGFLAVVAAIVIGLGYLVPIGLVCLLAWLVTRRVRKLASA